MWEGTLFQGTFQGHSSIFEVHPIKEGEERIIYWDFPGGPGFKNSPCNAEDMSLITGQDVKITHATEKLNLYVTTTKPAHYGAELEKPVYHNEDPA